MIGRLLCRLDLHRWKMSVDPRFFLPHHDGLSRYDWIVYSCRRCGEVDDEGLFAPSR